MSVKVDFEKVKELCTKVVVDNVSGIKFAEKSEGIYNYAWAGNNRFYVEIEESIIDYSITFRAVIEGVCFYEDIITEDVEGAGIESVAALCWTATYSRLIDLLVGRVVEFFEILDSETISDENITEEINWPSLLFEVCFYMKKRGYNKEGMDKLEDKAYELMFI
jgi:hypothetical protein